MNILLLRSDDANFINAFNTLYNLYCPVKKVKIKKTLVVQTHVVRRIIFTDYFFGKFPNLETKRTKTN